VLARGCLEMSRLPTEVASVELFLLKIANEARLWNRPMFYSSSKIRLEAASVQAMFEKPDYQHCRRISESGIATFGLCKDPSIGSFRGSPFAGAVGHHLRGTFVEAGHVLEIQTVDTFGRRASYNQRDKESQLINSPQTPGQA
jgi:hypothetical protein